MASGFVWKGAMNGNKWTAKPQREWGGNNENSTVLDISCDFTAHFQFCACQTNLTDTQHTMLLTVQERIQREGAGGAHPPPPWNDLWLSNTTGILQYGDIYDMFYVIALSKASFFVFPYKICLPVSYTSP